MPRISIVVPARDVLAYVGRVIDDVRRQSYRDLEVLVIDDRSRDATAEVVERVVAADRRFRLLQGEGQGPSAARNLGLQAASGELLAFVDADDRLAPDYLQRLVEEFDEVDADLAVCNARRLEGYRTGASGLHLRAFEDTPRVTHLRQSPQLVYDSTVWNKLFRRGLWDADGLSFPEGRWINDVYVSLRSHVLARRVVTVPETLYYWRIRADQTTSITDSKLTSPAARLKSLHDRAFAVERTRRMLAADLPEPVVLRAFDERVLIHDFWTYLPMYDESDTSFQKALLGHIGRYLDTFDVDPEGFDLGAVLRSFYSSVRAADYQEAARLLGRQIHARVTMRRGQLLSCVASAQATGAWWRQLFPSFESTRTEASLRVEARVHRVDLSPHGGDPLMLRGEVRIRDGRSDADGDWSMRMALRGKATGNYVAGKPSPVGAAADAHLHPLRRSGWRPFTVSVNLNDVEAEEQERVWHLELEGLLGQTPVPVRWRVTSEAARYLGTGRPLQAPHDLVLVPRGVDDLELRRERATTRLVAASGCSGSLTLKLEDDSATERPSEVWLQEPGGGAAESPVAYENEVELAVPTRQNHGRWELRCRVDGTTHRVRAGPQMRAASAPFGEEGVDELVIRPTVRGRVVVEIREPEPIIDRLMLDERTQTLTLQGPRLHPNLVPALALRLRCRWDPDVLDFPLDKSGSSWSASGLLHLLLGFGRAGQLARGWTLALVMSDAAEVAVRVPSERRDRYPLRAGTPSITAELRIGGGRKPVLWAEPHDVD